MIFLPRLWLVLGGSVVVVGAIWGVYAKGVHDGRAKVQADWNTARSLASEKALQQTTENRIETERRFKAQTEIIDNAWKERDRALLDAAAAVGAGERLRRESYRILNASCTSSNPHIIAGSKTTQSTADMLTNMQRRIDEATDRIARYADEAAAAGKACERSYNALNN